MVRALLFAFIISVSAFAAHADVMSEVDAELFENGSDASGSVKNIKADLRKCNTYADCSAVLAMCRWRPVSTSSATFVSNMAARVPMECKWPKPPATAPFVKCIDRLCTISADGKYY